VSKMFPRFMASFARIKAAESKSDSALPDSGGQQLRHLSPDSEVALASLGGAGAPAHAGGSKLRKCIDGTEHLGKVHAIFRKASSSSRYA